MIENRIAQNPPLPILPVRARDAHKGRFGTVLIVGGSLGMSGAAGLAGLAALRGGAGLVRVATPAPVLAIVASYERSYTTVPLEADKHGRISYRAFERVMEAAAEADWIALGPGLGRSLGLSRLVTRVYSELNRPLVLDADGLNALARENGQLPRPGGPRVLTPHPGEFRRLVGPSGDTRRPIEERWQLAQRCAADWGVILVYKGHPTLVTDGVRHYFNTTGNPGMATGGSGDVLTGLIAALGAQGLEPFSAAQLAVYLHGLAGDLAAAELTEEAMIASDLIDYLPRAFRQYRTVLSSAHEPSR